MNPAADPCTRDLGDQGEQKAIDWLIQHNIKIIARNYRSRTGEIDIIARDGKTLCFIEVRFRKSTRFGGAAASVTPRKQQRLRLCAQRYLQQNPSLQAPCRFDVIAIDGPDSVNWIKHAFC